jgi:hypothetical protein
VPVVLLQKRERRAVQVLEKHVERQAVQGAKRLGVLGLKMNTLSRRGYPDRLFLIPGGRPLFVEFKRPGIGRLTALQEKEICFLKKLGYSVSVYDSAKSAIREIEEMVDRNGTIWVFSTLQLGVDTFALFDNRTMRLIPDPNQKKGGAQHWLTLEDAVHAAVQLAEDLDYEEIFRLHAAGEL